MKKEKKKETAIIKTTIRRAQLALICMLIMGMLMGVMGGYVIGVKNATAMYDKTITIIKEGI